jgi:hypothetical protein
MRWLIRSRLAITSLGILGLITVLLDSHAQTSSPVKSRPVIYKNATYGFTFSLPQTWRGYSIVMERWEDSPQDDVLQSGPEITIRHPQWTPGNQRQDISIMVFTHAQWDSLQQGTFR